MAASACAPGGEREASSDQTRDRTLIVAAPAVPGGFDSDVLQPGTQHAIVQAYEPLISYAKTPSTEDEPGSIIPGQYEPALATDWEGSEDGLSYTITLRRGVQSPYGNELTADDVVWSWEKSFAQERTGNFIARTANVERVVAVDDYTVRFELSAPSPYFLDALTTYVPSIYDSTVMREHATADDPLALNFIATNTAGFGPYHLVELDPGVQAVFEVNENYYGEKPYFTRVIFREVPDAAAREQLLRAGEVDFVDSLGLDQIRSLAGVDGVKVQSIKAQTQARILMSMKYEPWDSLELRQAVNYAIPRDEVAEAVFGEFATPNVGPLAGPIQDICGPSGAWPYTYDPERARQLLADAGLGDQLTVTLQYSGNDWWQEPLAVQAQSALKEVGIDVELQRIPDAEYLARAAKGEQSLEFFTFHDNALILDPGYALEVSSETNAASNRNAYSNPEYDALIAEINSTLDPDRRCDLVHQAEAIHIADSPWIYGWSIEAIEVMRDDIAGWVYHAEDNERWADLYRTR